MNIVWKGSPNRQPRTKAVSKIIIHWFGVGTLESANNRFQNSASQVSAHYGISKGRVWQWVKENDIAYHAGNWPANETTVGIEHDAGINPAHDLAEQDYQLSAQLVREIAQRHGLKINKETVIGHRDVKQTQCPGTIDINKIINLANNMPENQTRVALGKDGQTVWECKPIALTLDEYKKQAGVEGIVVPDPIPPISSL